MELNYNNLEEKGRKFSLSFTLCAFISCPDLSTTERRSKYAKVVISATDLAACEMIYQEN
jgi:hypothetical protein